MNYKQPILLGFLPMLSLLGQANDSNAGRPTLEEIGVQGSQLGEIDLSRATILGGGAIESSKASTISDLSGLAPSLYINSNGIQSYGDLITLRGIGNTQLFGDPGVGLYIDGVAQGSTATYSSSLFDLESIEVLKGYQGYRFGKNTPGGVINIKSRKAADAHRSKLSASYASFNTQNYRVLADGPTGDNSSYYFGLKRAESDGFADNLNPRGNDASSESWNGRLGFDFTTENGLEIGIGGTWEEFNMGAQPLVPRTTSGNNKRVGFYDRNSSENETAQINSNSQFLKLSAPTNFGNITSVTSRFDWGINPSLVDLTFGDAQLANADLNAFGFISSTSKIIEDQERIAEELIFTSDEDADWIWQLGLYFANDEIEGSAERTFPNPGGWQENQLTSYTNELDSFVTFGSLNRSITDKTSLEIGIRYDTVDRKFTRNKVVTSNLGHNWADPSNGTYDEDFFSPSIAITHDIKDNISIFATVSQSFKPGGFSPYVDTNSTSLMGISNQQFSKETNLAYEVGMKLSSEDKLWNFDFAVFWSEVDDYQFEKPTGTTDYFVDNAEEVEIFGFEVEISGRPTDQLLMSLGYGLTDGEIKKHTSSSIVQTNVAPFFTILNSNFAGANIPYSPEHTFSATMDYLWSENLISHLGVRNIGNVHYLDQTANDTVNDSYTLLNASVSYLYNDWELNVFGTNLTDEEYYSSLVSSLSGVPGVVGSPRVIGLSISKEF
ncbi:MAG: TonB-dependent receptor [Verrucomicrobiota bacterium]|nr:TonB-dependent receptor [Verrucomicrobiota bacterium]